MKRKNVIKLVLLALLLVFLLLLPLLDMPSYVALFISIAFYSVGALGFRMLLLVGRFSLGQSFFVAIGAYTTSILTAKAGIDPWLGLLLAAVMGGIFAFLTGLVVLRVPGMYFAINTMALTMLAVQVLYLLPEFTGGAAGIGNIPAYTIGPYSFGVRPTPYYYMMLVILTITFIIVYRIEKSPLGLINRAIGQNDELTRHMGADITRQRMMVYTLTGVLTAVSGAFWAHYLHFVGPGQVGLGLGIYYQIYAIVGGLASPWGAILGVASLELASHWLGVALHVQPILYGAVLVGVFMVIPKGLLSLPGRIVALRRRRQHEIAPADAGIMAAPAGQANMSEGTETKESRKAGIR